MGIMVYPLLWGNAGFISSTVRKKASVKRETLSIFCNYKLQNPINSNSTLNPKP